MAKKSAATKAVAPVMSEDDKQAVLAQLERILADRLFSETTRMKRFLRYVTLEALAGRASRLKGYTIGLEVFDRPEDFDPQGDTIVRVQAGQLRRRLDLYYSGAGQDDPIRLTIPKGRYAPSFEFRNNTPEPETAKILQLIESPKARKLRPGLAVITLDNLSEVKDTDFFAEGLTAEIVSALVQFRHIRVVAIRPTVSSTSKGISTKDVAEKYDADFILSGSIRRAGDLFRVVVNLIVAETGQVLFGQTFDRTYTADHVFDLQESIASHVVALIAAPFGQINRFNRRAYAGRRNSVPAYEAVLRFYDMGMSPNLEQAKQLLEDVRQLTEEYDNFSTGYAIRALLHVYLCTQCVPHGDRRINLDAALSLASQATQVDPQNALGYFARFQALYHDGEIDKADRMAERTLALNPNDYLILAYFAVTEAFLGRIDTSKALSESARNLVGNPPPWFDIAPLALKVAQGEFDYVDDAIDSIDQDTALGLLFLKLAALGHLGKIEEACELLDRISKGDPDYLRHALETFEFWQASPHLDAAARAGSAPIVSAMEERRRKGQSKA